MLIRSEDLTQLKMVATDGTRHTIEDLFVSGDALALRYVAADVGGWFSDRKALVKIDRFEAPDVSGGVWPARIAEEELGVDAEARSAAGQLPGVMLGEVGASLSTEGLAARSGSGGSGQGTGAQADLRKVSDLLKGTAVGATDGDAGTLMGVIFETGDWAAKHLIIETGGNLPEHQRVVPFANVKGVGANGVRLDIDRRRVQDSPDLHQMDGLEGKWYNKVLAYYGMQS